MKLSSEILAIRGRIFPSTSANVTLEAVLVDGSIVRGESKISKSRRAIDLIRIKPSNCRPLPETLDAIRRADLVTLGPGSLYTSVIPNLLVKGISEAIARSPALKVYFVNLMWQPGETIDFSASRHVEAIHRHAGRNITGCVVLNSAPIPPALRRKYAKQNVKPVENDFEQLAALGVKVVTADLLGDINLVRHDPRALAEIVIELASRARARTVREQVLSLRKGRNHEAGLNGHHPGRRSGHSHEIEKAKVLHEAGGDTILNQVIRQALTVADPSNIIAVVGHQADPVRESVTAPIQFAIQAERKGPASCAVRAPFVGRLPNC